MSGPCRDYSRNHLHFITTSTYGRARLFDSLRFRQNFVREMLDRLTLPATVQDESRYRVWQRRVYDMNVWTRKKRREKLNYMHGNPVKRGLVDSPEKWPWSSFRFYFLHDVSLLAMDRLA